MRRLCGVLMASALALSLGLAVPPDLASAAGGGSGSSSGGSSSGSAASQYAKAKAKVDAGDYRSAVPMLDKIVAKNPRNADALNLLGYSHRKLGDRQKALSFYSRALAVDPDHLGANEYLGELYLEMNDVAKAQGRLDVLARACNRCEEWEDLAQAISAFKAKSS